MKERFKNWGFEGEEEEEGQENKSGIIKTIKWYICEKSRRAYFFIYSVHVISWTHPKKLKGREVALNRNISKNAFIKFIDVRISNHSSDSSTVKKIVSLSVQLFRKMVLGTYCPPVSPFYLFICISTAAVETELWM